MTRATTRTVPVPADVEGVRRLVSSTEFFSREEIEIAVELVRERLVRGDASGYFFHFLDRDLGLAAYTCFGPIPGTVTSFDLYWIAVDRSQQRGGLGAIVLASTEQSVRDAGGTRIYAETSSRPQYAPTHRFYERQGFRQAAFLEDYYAPGDGKLTYLKVL